MSQKNTYPIRCPQCEGQQDEELYDSIDISADPSLKALLLENKVNVVTCVGCGHQFRVDKNLLYNDPNRKLMIYLKPTQVDQHSEAEDEFRSVIQDLELSLPEENHLPNVELVLSRIELVERIFIHEAELNQRVVEYVKYMIYTQNLDQLMPEEKALLFNAQDSTDEELCFVLQDVQSQKLESVLQYKRQGYDSVLELLEQDGENSLVAQLFPGPYISARAYLMGEEI